MLRFSYLPSSSFPFSRPPPLSLLSSVFFSSSSVRVLFRAEFDTAVHCEWCKDATRATTAHVFLQISKRLKSCRCSSLSPIVKQRRQLCTVAIETVLLYLRRVLIARASRQSAFCYETCVPLCCFLRKQSWETA